MDTLDFHCRPALGDDADMILGWMRAFYAEDHLVFDELAATGVVRELLARPEFGRILLLEANDVLAGYAVLTFGYSLEFHGRYLLLDELYLVPALRGRGLGHRSLVLIEAWARTAGVKTVRLEVNRANVHARSVYLKAGFVDGRRDVFTQWLD